MLGLDAWEGPAASSDRPRGWGPLGPSFRRFDRATVSPPSRAARRGRREWFPGVQAGGDSSTAGLAARRLPHVTRCQLAQRGHVGQLAGWLAAGLQVAQQLAGWPPGVLAGGLPGSGFAGCCLPARRARVAGRRSAARIGPNRPAKKGFGPGRVQWSGWAELRAVVVGCSGETPIIGPTPTVGATPIVGVAPIVGAGLYLLLAR